MGVSVVSCIVNTTWLAQCRLVAHCGLGDVSILQFEQGNVKHAISWRG